MSATADVDTTSPRMYRRPAAAEPVVDAGARVPGPRTPLAAPAPSVPVFENEGYCACCRNQTTFVAHDTWLRDFYLCARCGSVPRQRHLQTVLDENVPGWHDLEMHESSPSNDFLSRVVANYSCSQYFPDVPRGESRDGVRSEDVEALTFADGSLDLFITQDVLEHVFHPDRAIREIHRVLRPGGAHVFTAPKHRGLAVSRRRARIDADGNVQHLWRPEYHGNPIGDNKALVTWDYGHDVERLMSEWAGAPVQTHHRVERARGLDAEFNEVFVIRKAPLPPAAEPAPEVGPRGRRAALGQIARGVTDLVRPRRAGA